MRRWCSWCFEKTEHELIETKTIFKNKYFCTNCNMDTVECSFCKNMARTGKHWDNICCAVHDGTIANFESLNKKIKEITNWRQITKRKGANIPILAKKASAAVVVGLAGCGVGLAVAPVIGGIIGGLGELSGAAAVSHGLAVLGGGALAEGGLGMAGGTTLICISAGLLGSRKGGILLNKYVSEIEGFNIIKRHRGTGVKVIYINGFLTQGENLLHEWRPTFLDHFSKNEWYEVAWESKKLETLGTIAFLGKASFMKSVKKSALVATKQASKKLNPLFLYYAMLDLLGNHWHVAMVKAQKTGQSLADLILRTQDNSKYILIGHSLGARVIFFTLQALAKANIKNQKIKEVHLLGGAIENNKKSWKGLSGVVESKIYNYYSNNDLILQTFYKVPTFFMSKPIGLNPIDIHSAKIKNVNVSSMVNGHGEFKHKFAEFIYGK